jgi:uncharacterized damage-inducible protein DinB
MTQQESRTDEGERVRGYLVSQAARRTPEQLVEAVREAHRQLLDAVAAVPDEAFHRVPREGEWAAADVLEHVRTMAAMEALSIPAAAERGERPAKIRDTIEPAPADATREALLASINAARERLFAAVLEADPDAHLDVRWTVSMFGELNWRECLLFARVHTLDHARQMAAIAEAVDGGQSAVGSRQ